MKKNYIYIVLFLFLFMLVSCNGEPKDSRSIALDGTYIGLEQDEEIEFGAKLQGIEGTINWSSSDSNVAIYEDGKIKAIGGGECTITASIDDITATVTVLVTGKEKEITFTVKFLDDQYTTIKTEEVEKGKAATAPVMTSTDSKVFYQWDKDFSNIQSDLTVIAIYKTKYKVTYNLGGGTLDGTKVESYFEGEGFDLPTAHKGGTKFLGWEDTSKPGVIITSIEAGKKEDIALTAKYEEVTNMNVTFDYYNGICNEIYLNDKDHATATIEINNYNDVFGAFWGGQYPYYSFITDSSHDPMATFSDRIYVGLDSETGLYKVLSILLSGGSDWPEGADYVITYSNSYQSYVKCHQQALKVNVGDYVVFDGDFTKIKTIKKVNAYFFNGDPVEQKMNRTMDISKDKFINPSRLGYKFVGWKDAYGNILTKESEVYEGAALTAEWEERTPVTGIRTNYVITEMITGNSFTISAKVTPSDAYFQTIYYESSNPDIITVDGSGVMNAKNAGTATITMTDYMKKVTVSKTITVYPIDCIDLNLGNFNGVLAIGETLELNPVAYGKKVKDITFTYTSKTPDILEVSSAGVIKALANGVGKIEIKDSATTTHTLEIGVVVNPLVDTERVDQVLAILAKYNIASIQTGNACIYSDGNDRYYRSMYSSVNYFLFQDYAVDNTYLNSVENLLGSPKRRRTEDGRDDTIQFVTVHDTATLTSSAAGTAAGMNTSGSSGSATIHYATGQNKIYSAVDEKFIAYHAGDGTSNNFEWYKTNVKAPTTGDQTPNYTLYKKAGGIYTYGINGQDSGIQVPAMENGKRPKLTLLGPTWKVVDGYYYLGKTWYCSDYGGICSFGGNNNSIGIEMGVNANDDIYNTWQVTAQLVADICVRNGLPTSRVQMHDTWIGKYCPQCLITGSYWYNFMKMVEVNYIIMKDYKDAKITMTTNDTNILSASGRVVNPPTTTTTVSYTVTVEIGGIKKSMTFYNVVPGTTTWEQWNGSYPDSKIWNNNYFSKNDLVNKPYDFKNVTIVE